MAISFPSALDSLTNPSGSHMLVSPDHAQQHSDANDAIEALEAKVGVNGSSVTTSLDYLLKSVSSVNPGHKHTLASITDFPSHTGDSGKFLTTNGSVASWATVSGMAVGNAVSGASADTILLVDGSGNLASSND